MTQRRPPPEVELQRTRQWRAAHPDRVRLMGWAHNRVFRAVRAGELVRPDRCSLCNRVAFLEASHSDYEKPLEVVWLCRSCHRLADSSNPKSMVQAEAYVAVRRKRHRTFLHCDTHDDDEWFAYSCATCGRSRCSHGAEFQWFVCRRSEYAIRRKFNHEQRKLRALTPVAPTVLAQDTAAPR